MFSTITLNLVWHRIWTGSLWIIFVYSGVLALLWWAQEKLLFLPTVLPQDHRFAVAADVHETWVEVEGARLNALHLKLPKPDGVVLFLHGNAGSLDNWFAHIEPYRQANMDLFMIDYRGYGKSSGRISSEAQLHADVLAAWQQLTPRYEGLRRVVLGRSLGAGPAAHLAAQVQPDLTLLVSPYSSMQALAKEIYPWVPGTLLRYPLRTDLALPLITGDIWIAHGERDRLIPASHAKTLQALVPRAQLLLLPQAEHNDIQLWPEYAAALQQVLRSIR